MNQLKSCPNCGVRLVPSPKEFKSLRKLTGLSQREFGALLRVKAAHIAYLESGRRSPSGELILRYRKAEQQLLAAAAKKVKRVELRVGMQTRS